MAAAAPAGDSEQVARLLLKAAADPNAVDSLKMTPLHIACRCGVGHCDAS